MSTAPAPSTLPAPTCHRISIRDNLNPHIICVLCQGYFIDPVTITECLHSFCKTCLVKYVERDKKCPICDMPIHKTRPLVNVRSDKTLQDIVYKLVPGLHHDEMARRQAFFKRHPPKGDQFSNFKQEKEKIFFSEDDKFSMSIQYFETGDLEQQGRGGGGSSSKTGSSSNGRSSKENNNKRYLECPGMLKMKHLKKFIIKKYGLNFDEFLVEVIYKDEIIPEEYSIIDVAYLHNYRKDRPMQFFYRIFRKNKVLLRKRKVQNISSSSKLVQNSADSSSSAAATESDSKRIKLDKEESDIKKKDAVKKETTATFSSTSTPSQPRPSSSSSTHKQPSSSTHKPKSPQLRQSSFKPPPMSSITKVATPGSSLAASLSRVSSSSSTAASSSSSASSKCYGSAIPSSKPKQPFVPSPSAANLPKQIPDKDRFKAILPAAAAISTTAATATAPKVIATSLATAAPSLSSSLAMEQKMAIRNFRPGQQQPLQQQQLQQQPQPQQQNSSPAPIISNSNSNSNTNQQKLNSIVWNLQKKQLETSLPSASSSPPPPPPTAAARGFSKTTIQKTTVNLGSSSLPSVASGATTSATSTNSTSSAERRLAKSIPSSTTITVKMPGSGGGGDGNKYNSKDGVITPILKKSDSNGDSVKKSLSDRSFLKLSTLATMSEVLSKQKASAAAAVMAGMIQQPLPSVTTATAELYYRKAAENAIAAAAAAVSTKAAAASSPTSMRLHYPPTLSSVLTTPASPLPGGNNSTQMVMASAMPLPVSSQIPNNRLQLKVQQQPMPASTTLLKAPSPKPQNMLSFSKPAASSVASAPSVVKEFKEFKSLHSSQGKCGGDLVTKPKTLQNQGIRQIPNPSLLTKQKNGTADITAKASAAATPAAIMKSVD